MKAKTKLLSIAIVFLIGTSALSILPRQAKSATTGLVGHWTFDDGSGNIAHDSSGNGNDGTIHNATRTTGKEGNALHFNGVDSWVEIPTSPTLTGLSQITLEAWVQEDSISAQLKGIISKCDGAAPPINAEYFLGTNDGGRLFFETDNSVAIFSSQSDRLITQTGRWYYVSGTWSGSSYAIYVNAVQVLSGTCTPQTTSSNSLPVQIGRHGGSWPWVYFNGIIDEVKIYNRALTSEEVYSDYTETAPTTSGMQWWFWTIIALGATAVVLAITTVHYRKKPAVSKATSVIQSKTTQKASMVCPNCGANLPADSKFCGKCGASLQ